MALTYATTGVVDVGTQRRRAETTQRLMAIVVLATAVVVAGLAVAQPRPGFWLTSVLLLVAMAAITARPKVGIFVAVGFALLADNTVLPWYPFVKNASSVESVFYIHDSFIASPLEFLLLITTVVWLTGLLVDRTPAVRIGTLGRPVAAFGAFVVFGLLRGLAAGGDAVVALWQARPMLYLPLAYLLATNLFTSPKDYRRLGGIIALALLVEGLSGSWFILSLSPEEAVRFDGGRSYVEHTAALHMNTLFVLLASALVVPGVAARYRLLLLLASTPVAFVYFNSQRRAAFVALGMAAILVGMMLFWRNRQRFFKVVPVVAVLFGAYLGLFWNQHSDALGFPAQAVKSVIAPGDISQADQSSNNYRVVENYNLVETIRSAPVTGIGFGRPFLRPIPLPDISFTPFWEYIPHNSLLYLWTATGVGGILSLLYLTAGALSRGIVALRRSVGSAADQIVLLASVAYIGMFLAFSYADISWDAQTTMYLGIATAAVGNAVRLADPPLPVEAEPPDRLSAAGSRARR